MNEIVKKNGINFGIITGIISILITATIYAIDINMFASMTVGLSMLLIYIIIGIVLLSKTKKELKGVFPFKQAFTTYFISAVIGILISVVFSILLFNFIDPGVKDTLKDITLKSKVEFMEKMGTPSSEINKAVEKLEGTDQFSIVELLKGSIYYILFYSIIGLILAAIFKSKTIEKI